MKLLALTLAVTADGVSALDGGGWASFGITGMILGWLLLRHLPDKDRQMKDLIQAFMDRDDRRAKEQIDWRTTIVEEMRKDRHEVNNSIQRVISSLAEVEETLRQEIQKKAGYVKTELIVPLALASFLLLGSLHCSRPAISSARCAFDEACATYEQKL